MAISRASGRPGSIQGAPFKGHVVHLVTRTYWPDVGGIERQMTSVAALVTDLGGSVEVWTTTSQPHVPDGARCHVAPSWANAIRRFSLWMALSLLWDSPRIRRERGVAVVGRASAEAAVFLALSRLLRLAVVVYLAGGDELGSEFARQRRRWLRSLLLSRADAFVAHTPRFISEVRAAGYAGTCHVVPTILPNAEPDRCIDLEVPSTHIRAIWCGRNHPVKNLPRLERLASGAFRRSGIHLIVVIDRPPEGCFEGSTVHPRCPSPRQHMRMADVVVFTSLHEAQPNVLAEAAAEGVPAVAFDVGGMREAMTMLGHGVALPEDCEDDEFAKAVDDLANKYRHPDRKRHLREAAHTLYQTDARRAWTQVLLEGARALGTAGGKGRKA